MRARGGRNVGGGAIEHDAVEAFEREVLAVNGDQSHICEPVRMTISSGASAAWHSPCAIAGLLQNLSTSLGCAVHFMRGGGKIVAIFFGQRFGPAATVADHVHGLAGGDQLAGSLMENLIAEANVRRCDCVTRVRTMSTSSKRAGCL